MIINSDGSRLPSIIGNGVYGFFGKYRFLSNFHICKVPLNGFIFNSSEHAYMAQKCSDIWDWHILEAHPSPKFAKEFGRGVHLSVGWDDRRLAAMKLACRIKFQENKDLGDMLLATGDMHLEETNNWNDTFWGVCCGEGENNLGQILMRVRKELVDIRQ